MRLSKRVCRVAKSSPLSGVRTSCLGQRHVREQVPSNRSERFLKQSQFQFPWIGQRVLTSRDCALATWFYAQHTGSCLSSTLITQSFRAIPTSKSCPSSAALACMPSVPALRPLVPMASGRRALLVNEIRLYARADVVSSSESSRTAGRLLCFS